MFAMSLGGLVAGPRIERGPQGYEPCEMPLLYPAMFINTILYKKMPLKALLYVFYLKLPKKQPKDG
jgi:hypothetical protein